CFAANGLRRGTFPRKRLKPLRGAFPQVRGALPRRPGRLVAGEPAVGHAVRTGRFGAEAVDLVLLVGLEVALEPEPVRAALPGQDVRGHPVKEPSVVAGCARHTR